MISNISKDASAASTISAEEAIENAMETNRTGQEKRITE